MSLNRMCYGGRVRTGVFSRRRDGRRHARRRNPNGVEGWRWEIAETGAGKFAIERGPAYDDENDDHVKLTMRPAPPHLCAAHADAGGGTWRVGRRTRFAKAARRIA